MSMPLPEKSSCDIASNYFDSIDQFRGVFGYIDRDKGYNFSIYFDNTQSDHTISNMLRDFS